MNVVLAGRCEGIRDNQLANTVSILDPSTRTVVKTLAFGGKPNGILFRAN